MDPSKLAHIISQAVNKAISSNNAGSLQQEDMPSVEEIVVSHPKQVEHGDWSTNIALQLAKKAQLPPRQLAEKIAPYLEKIEGIKHVEIAGPGFINLFIESHSAGEIINDILETKEKFGTNNSLEGTVFNLEFVSANPTGPIHIGGTRWAAVGDALGNILQANGGSVIREYYFNDHGVQIDHFSQSLVACAHQEDVPTEGYQGQYISDITQQVMEKASQEGIDILSLPRVTDENGDEGDSEQREAFRRIGVELMFEEIKKSLAEFRVHFDVWFHEMSLYESGAVTESLDELKARGDLYDKDGATWFETTKYGDDKDRVIIKSDGDTTYFVSDIAYYRNKRHRSHNPADICIYMLGADHHGYVGRLEAVCAAFGDTPYENMQVLIGQLVSVMKNGSPVRMSKRAGTVITLEDLVDAVGIDAARYSLTRSSYNQMLVVDLDLIASHSNDNPVYYVQYAHARSINVDRTAQEAGIKTQDADLSLLDLQEDRDILNQLALYPSVIKAAAQLREPHRVAHYLEDLAAVYHTWYAAERVVPLPLTEKEKEGDKHRVELLQKTKCPEIPRAAARLKLNDAVQQVLKNGLSLLAVSAPDKM